MQIDIQELSEKFYNATVTDLQMVHEDLFVLGVKPDFEFDLFKAGQYVSLGLGGWEQPVYTSSEINPEEKQYKRVIKRPYSISVNPKSYLNRFEDNTLYFYIVLVNNDDEKPPMLTPRLISSKVGDRMFIGKKGIGSYSLEHLRSEAETVVFLASGTGEAPHTQMIAELLSENRDINIVSAVSCRFEKDFAYREAYKKLEDENPNFFYYTTSTRETGKGKRIQNLLAEGLLEEYCQLQFKPENTDFYLCGNPAMIGAPRYSRKEQNWEWPHSHGVIPRLKDLGFTVEKLDEHPSVHYESYW